MGQHCIKNNFPAISEFYCSRSLLTSWSDFTLGLIQQNLYVQIWIMNSLVNTALLSKIYFFNSEKYVDAKWFTRDEVRSVLDHKAGTRFDKSDYKKMNEMTEGRSNFEQNAKVDLAIQPTESKNTPKHSSYSDEPPFKLPNVSAIAGVLIRDWVDGKIGFPQESAKVMMQRGNL
jgi:hypothetical protein